MNILQTYYSQTSGTDPILDKAGFLSPEFNWMSMALSCLLLKRHYGHVTLYCNERAKVVVEELRIPYDSIVIMPNIMDKYEGCELWALPKVFTYSQQQSPFVHVDCDFLLFDKLPNEYWKSDIFAQNIEFDDQLYNRQCIERFKKAGGELPPFVYPEVDEAIISVLNAGIIGGNDIEFIHRYTESIYQFIHKNQDVLRSVHDGFINSIYEQMFFYCLAKSNNKTVSLCIKGEKLSTLYDWMKVDMSCMKKRGYCHMLAGIKRRRTSQIFVSRLLEKMAPELHHHIINTYIKHGGIPSQNYLNFVDKVFVQNYRDHKSIFSRSNELEPNLDHSLISEIVHLDETLENVQKHLMDNRLHMFLTHFKSVNSFWGIERLSESNCFLTVNPNVMKSYVSWNALKLICNVPKGMRGKALVLTVPDAFRFSVYEVVACGVMGKISKLLESLGKASPQEVIHRVCNVRSNISVNEKIDYERYVENMLYQMIENSILVVLDS